MNGRLELSIRRVVLATIALLVLAGVSWGISSLHLPPWPAVAIALGVAAAKVTLVMLFFMELAEPRASLRLVALTAPAFLALLLLLSLADVWTR